MRLKELKRKADKIEREVQEKMRELQKVLLQAKFQYETLIIDATKGLAKEQKRKKKFSP